MTKEDLQTGPSAKIGAGRKLVLGFSGGLDTSYCVKYLSEDLGFEVHSIIVNTGGFTKDELEAIRQTCAQAWGKVTHDS